MNTKQIVSRYRHIIFDLDMTLTTVQVDWSLWNDMFLSIAAKYRESYHLGNTRENYALLNEIIYTDGDIAAKDIKSQIQQFERKHYNGKKHALYPHMARFLSTVPLSTPISIWTNNTMYIAHKALHEMDLFDRCTHIVACDTVRFPKPDREGFLHIWDTVMPWSQYVLIGDSENDAYAARASEIDFVHVHTIG